MWGSSVYTRSNQNGFGWGKLSPNKRSLPRMLAALKKPQHWALSKSHQNRFSEEHSALLATVEQDAAKKICRSERG
jgi:hypothetical protein